MQVHDDCIHNIGNFQLLPCQFSRLCSLQLLVPLQMVQCNDVGGVMVWFFDGEVCAKILPFPLFRSGSVVGAML